MKFTTKLELTTKCSHSPRLLAHQAEQQSFKGCRHPRDMFSSLGSGARADSPSKGIRDNSSCRDFLSGFSWPYSFVDNRAASVLDRGVFQ